MWHCPLFDAHQSRCIGWRAASAGDFPPQMRVNPLLHLHQVLHRLELNLDPLLGRLPVSVSRAYARQLQLSIPWTALATQPIQARGSNHRHR